MLQNRNTVKDDIDFFERMLVDYITIYKNKTAGEMPFTTTFRSEYLIRVLKGMGLYSQSSVLCWVKEQDIIDILQLLKMEDGDE